MSSRVTHKITNFRIFMVAKTGNKAKQITKHASAARLHAPKMRSRSHLLTVDATLLVSTEFDTTGIVDMRADGCMKPCV